MIFQVSDAPHKASVNLITSVLDRSRSDGTNRLPPVWLRSMIGWCICGTGTSLPKRVRLLISGLFEHKRGRGVHSGGCAGSEALVFGVAEAVGVAGNGLLRCGAAATLNVPRKNLPR